MQRCVQGAVCVSSMLTAVNEVRHPANAKLSVCPMRPCPSSITRAQTSCCSAGMPSVMVVSALHRSCAGSLQQRQQIKCKHGLYNGFKGKLWAEDGGANPPHAGHHQCTEQLLQWQTPSPQSVWRRDIVGPSFLLLSGCLTTRSDPQ